jgi:hypothetical protein
MFTWGTVQPPRALHKVRRNAVKRWAYTLGNMPTKKKPAKRKAKARTQYVLMISYSLRKHQWGSLDSSLQKKLGSSAGSGTGFGWRDIDWWFKTRKARDAAAKKAMDMKLTGVKIETSEYRDED